MKFGMFFEMTLPRPWEKDSESRKVAETIEQIQLGDRIGIHNAWMTEHHFMEEYCHATAPEVILAAAAQVTKRIRIGHGVRHAPPRYNHPARSAEQAASLDLVSKGRLELGFGSSSTEVELGGFLIPNEEKHAMTWEAIEQICNMMAMEPFPGFKGKYFEMPARNVVPKPVQKPHPPLWYACSARPSIIDAAQRGMGVLAFSFLEAADAKMWVDEYYSQFKTNCRPIGHAVNPNFNLFTALGVHQDDDVAADRFLEGLYFFQFMINHYYKTGQTSISHKPGRTNLWQHFLESRQTLQESADNMEEARQLASSRQAIGSIERVRKRLRDLRDAGVDHVTFLMQMGKTKHEHICESLELFGKEILPEFLDDDEKRVKAKEVELAPYVEKAFERIGGRRMTHVPDEAIPNIEPKLYVGWGQKTDVVLGMKTTSTDA